MLARSGLEQSGLKFRPLEAMVFCHVGEDGGQGAHPQGSAGRDGDAVFAASLGHKSHVAALLADDFVAEVTLEEPGEITTGEVPRQPHTANSSSWTKWSLTSCGRSSSSSS